MGWRAKLNSLGWQKGKHTHIHTPTTWQDLIQGPDEWQAFSSSEKLKRKEDTEQENH